MQRSSGKVSGASKKTAKIQNIAACDCLDILQHSNFVQTTGGTFTGTVAHTGTLNVSGGTLTTSTAQKDAIVDGSTAISRSGNNLTFAGNATVTGDLTVSGTTTTIDTTVTASDAIVVNNAGSDVGLKINSTSSGHIMQLQDNGTDVMMVEDGGDISTGTANKIKQKGAFMQSSTHQALALGA